MRYAPIRITDRKRVLHEGAKTTSLSLHELSMPIVFKNRVFSVEVARKRFPNGREHEITVVSS
jgi:hypothetical protein